MRDELAAIFETKTAAEWHAVLAEHDCCVEVILEPEELADHPLHQARGVFFEVDGGAGVGPMRQVRTPWASRRRRGRRRGWASTRARCSPRRASTTPRSRRCRRGRRSGAALSYTRAMDPSNLVDRVRELWDVAGVRAGLIIVGAVIAAKLLELVLRKTLVALAQLTDTKLDDLVIDALRRPIFLTAVLVGVGWASAELPFSPSERDDLLAGRDDHGDLVGSGDVPGGPRGARGDQPAGEARPRSCSRARCRCSRCS